MALDIQSLTRMHSTPYAAGSVKSVFHYVSADTVAAVIASGYFNSATKTLRKGDLIMVSGVNGGTPTCSLIVVTSADNAAVVTTAVAIFA